MNSSVKFFAPSVTAGLPLPGWPLGGLALELELELSSEPHAVSAMASDTVSRASMALYQVRYVIRFPPLRLSCGLERGALGLLSAPPAQRLRRRIALQEREESVRRECQHRDQQRSRDYAFESVAGLVRDDVAESSGRSGDRGQRRGGHDVERRRAQAREQQRERQRKLDPPERLRARHAHPAGGLEQVAVDAVDGHVGVGEDH